MLEVRSEHEALEDKVRVEGEKKEVGDNVPEEAFLKCCAVSCPAGCGWQQ